MHPRGFDDARTFFHLESQRLFDVHIFPGVKSVDGDGGVPVIGGGNDDGVESGTSRRRRWS